MPQVYPVLLEGLPNELLDLIQKAPLPGLDGIPKSKATAQRIETLLGQHPVLEQLANYVG